jgi:hypothetical protein
MFPEGEIRAAATGGVGMAVLKLIAALHGP